MRVAHARHLLAAGQEILAGIGQPSHLGIQQGHVDMLTLAGLVAVVERGKDRDQTVHAGHQVGDADTELLRVAVSVRP